MAHPTLPVLSLPGFPQVFSRVIDQQIKSVDRTLLGRRQLLTTCDYNTPESSWGACDGYPCGSMATVHHLESGQEFCPKHFRAVSLEEALAELEAGRG